jgi:gluconolactonase
VEAVTAPASTFDVWDPRFHDLVPEDAQAQRVAGGFGFTEGPVWMGDHLLFSDIARSRIVRWAELPEGPTVTTYRYPSHLSNGLTLDRSGRLVACEGNSRRLTRTESDGSSTVLAATYEGKRLNAPNDVIVASDGTIYFSDPFWGHLFDNPVGRRVQLEDRELPFAAAFRLATDGSLSVVADDFVVPNGLALSPDERTLYVDDSRHHHIRAFDVLPDGTFASDRVFVEMRSAERGAADGMKLDRHGNIYCTASGGVWVVAPDGAALGRIRLPEQPANVGWGDGDWKTLYMCAETSLYRIRLNVPGIPVFG